MKIVLQRVSHARVSVKREDISPGDTEEWGEVAGEIGTGFLLLLGVEDCDTIQTADRMVDKICKLRIFEDGDGKTNLSLADVGGEILVVSQFTLYADCKKGNRPSFTHAGSPDMAEVLYEHAADRCGMYVGKTARGKFGAHMKIDLQNDGPFTLVLDSRELGIW